MRRFGLLLGIAGFAAFLQAQTATPAPPTFNKEVVRIFQNNCQSCHHPGDIAPFSLMDYASARPWAFDIEQQVQQHLMPPWKPSQGANVFLGARVLAQGDIDTLSAWVAAGAPEGNPADLPVPLTFPNGWDLGLPDLLLQPSQAFAVYAVGNDIYRCYSLPTNLPADTYVNAIQVRPGDPSVVHHVVLYSDSTGQSAALDAVDPLPGYSCFGDPGFSPDYRFFGAWAPGSRPSFLDAGTAMLIPKGGYIAMQVHYHPSGTDTTDQTQVGLYFTKAPIDKLVYFNVLVNFTFTIPAGNPHYPVTYSTNVGTTAHLTNIFPHQHLLGTESHTQLVSGSTTTALMDILSWDFNWQGLYTYVTPVPMKPTDTLQFTKYFDNSANNPRNPNSPPLPVSWGEQTTDEMAVDLIGFTKDSEHLLPTPVFNAASIVNAASYASGTAAPGAIMSLFGTGLGSNWAAASGTVPTTLANTKISVSGVSGYVPLFYASPSQVNFQMPFEASGNVTLTLIREDNKTTAVTIPIGAAQPGLFSADSSGTGAAAAQRADFSALSDANPAARGEEVVLYATGLGKAPGAVTGQGASGAATATNAVAVTVGGRAVTPDYAGLTPGFVGLYQVNFHIPADLTVTGDVPVTVTAAGVASNTVTIAVR